MSLKGVGIFIIFHKPKKHTQFVIFWVGPECYHELAPKKTFFFFFVDNDEIF